MKRNPFLLERLVGELDAFGQTKSTYTPLGTVELSVYLKDANYNSSDPRYMNTTHVAFGRARYIKEGDRLTGDKTYIVKSVVSSHRRTHLLLEEVA